MTRRGWVLFALMSVIWGIPYLLIKVADGGVSVPVLVFGRTAIGALVLLPLALRRGELSAMRPFWRWLVVFAVIEIILPWALLSDAERRLPSSLTGILIASVPIIGAVLARLTGDNDRLTVMRWAGLALGLGGVVLLAGPTARGGDAWAVTEVLLTALGYSIGPLIASRKLSGAPSLGVNTMCLSFAALVYAPFAALTWPHTVPRGSVILSIVALGVLCTGAAFMLFFALIAEAGPARATVITYVNPAVAVALGVAVLGERLTPVTVASFVLILVGSFFATRSGGARLRAGGSGRQGKPAQDPEPVQEGPGGTLGFSRDAGPSGGADNRAGKFLSWRGHRSRGTRRSSQACASDRSGHPGPQLPGRSPHAQAAVHRGPEPRLRVHDSWGLRRGGWTAAFGVGRDGPLLASLILGWRPRGVGLD